MEEIITALLAQGFDLLKYDLNHMIPKSDDSYRNSSMSQLLGVTLNFCQNGIKKALQPVFNRFSTNVTAKKYKFNPDLKKRLRQGKHKSRWNKINPYQWYNPTPVPDHYDVNDMSICFTNGEEEHEYYRGQLVEKEKGFKDFKVAYLIEDVILIEALVKFAIKHYPTSYFGSPCQIVLKTFETIKSINNQDTCDKIPQSAQELKEITDLLKKTSTIFDLFPVWNFKDEIVYYHYNTKDSEEQLVKGFYIVSDSREAVQHLINQFDEKKIKVEREQMLDHITQMEAEKRSQLVNSVDFKSKTSDDANKNATNELSSASSDNTGNAEFGDYHSFRKVMPNRKRGQLHSIDLIKWYQNDQELDKRSDYKRVDKKWTFDAMVFKQREKLLRFTEKFEHDMTTDDAFGNRQFGILVHGPPGTGKSKFSVALANYLQKHIAIVDFSQNIDRDTLKNAFDAAISEGYILQFDEFDKLIDSMKKNQFIDVANKRKEELESLEREMKLYDSTSDEFKNVSKRYRTLKDKKIEQPIDMAFLLSLLDGVNDTSGRIIMATTNYPENIEAALIRPGRFDFQLEFGNFQHEEIKQLLRIIYAKDFEGHCGLNAIYRLKTELPNGTREFNTKHYKFLETIIEKDFPNNKHLCQKINEVNLLIILNTDESVELTSTLLRNLQLELYKLFKDRFTELNAWYNSIQFPSNIWSPAEVVTVHKMHNDLKETTQYLLEHQPISIENATRKVNNINNKKKGMDNLLVSMKLVNKKLKSIFSQNDNLSLEELNKKLFEAFNDDPMSCSLIRAL